MTPTEDSARLAEDCLVCGRPVVKTLDLGSQPLANALIDEPDAPYSEYPLGLARCPSCTHAQLTHFLAPEILFQDYLYASGTSGTLRAYFDWFAASLAQALPQNARILELASNDGSLLDSLRAQGFTPTGIDPAHNLCEVARAKGHAVLEGFFPETRPDTAADVIVAMNVAAHTPNLRDFMAGVATTLTPDGVAIIQTSQAFMIGNGEFDTIYHEHFSFYTVASMARLAELSGLRLDAVQLVSVHGTSFLFFLRPAASQGPGVDFRWCAPFAVAWPEPAPTFLDRGFGGAEAEAAYETFASDARRLMCDVATRISDHRAAGRRIGLVGVAAKALTFIRAAGIEPDALFDEAALKVGRVVPGAQTPIRPLSDVAALTGEWVFLIGAWNFAEELSAKIAAFRGGERDGLRVLVHLPALREFPLGEPAEAS